MKHLQVYMFNKKSAWRFPEFLIGKMFFAFLQKNLVNVAMRMDEAFYNLFMYLYNKNVLEYAQIAWNGPKSMIRDNEGLSIN